MNMNSNAFLDRVEIIFYSTLISCMSGVNRIRAHLLHRVPFPYHPAVDEDATSQKNNDPQPEKLLINRWIYISQALVPLCIWMILGFAAGFLIGMLRSG